MPLDFVLLGSFAFGGYALTYLALRRRISRAEELLAKLGAKERSATQSYLINWAFRGRGAKQDRLARLFSVLPPLMVVVTAAGMIFSFLTAVAFMRLANSVGLLVAVAVFTLPFYRAADVFDMFLMVGAARHAGASRLSNEDVRMLEAARSTLSGGSYYFGRLSVLLFVGLSLLYAVDPFANRLLISLYPDLSSGLLVFVGVVAMILAGTYMTPRAPLDVVAESGDTREVAMPQAGDHLSYGAVWTLEATRARLMRKFRLPRQYEEEPDSGKG